MGLGIFSYIWGGAEALPFFIFTLLSMKKSAKNLTQFLSYAIAERSNDHPHHGQRPQSIPSSHSLGANPRDSWSGSIDSSGTNSQHPCDLQRTDRVPRSRSSRHEQDRLADQVNQVAGILPVPGLFPSLKSSFPSQMYTCALSRTHTNRTNGPKTPLVIDWLTITYERSTLTAAMIEQEGYSLKNDNFTAIVEPGGNRRYTHSGKIYSDGVEVARFVFGNRHDVEPTLTLTLSNHVFYNSSVSPYGFHDLIGEFGTLLASSSPRVSRLDIAIDGLDLLPMVQRANSGAIVKRGKAKFVDAGGQSTSVWSVKNQRFEGIRIGSRSSGRFFRYYNKSAELLCNDRRKDFIRDYLELNNVASVDNGDVFRAEFELTTAFFRAYAQDFKVSDLDSFDRLTDLYVLASNQGNFLDFAIPNPSDSNRRRWGVVHLLGDAIAASKPVFQRAVKKVVNSLKSVKTTVNRLIKESISSPCDSFAVNMIDAARDLVHYNDLEPWLKRKWPILATELHYLNAVSANSKDTGGLLKNLIDVR